MHQLYTYLDLFEESFLNNTLYIIFTRAYIASIYTKCLSTKKKRKKKLHNIFTYSEIYVVNLTYMNHKLYKCVSVNIA
jgi:hypothetical protein